MGGVAFVSKDLGGTSGFPSSRPSCAPRGHRRHARPDPKTARGHRRELTERLLRKAFDAGLKLPEPTGRPRRSGRLDFVRPSGLSCAARCKTAFGNDSATIDRQF
jgi:hypothetical protein